MAPVRTRTRPLTWATADLAIIALTVDIVAFTVAPKDLLVGDVTGMAHALPTDAVPQPRAHNGAVVLPAASLQLLAAPALGLALTVFPNVACIAPGAEGAALRPSPVMGSPPVPQGPTLL
jgi:hypothetical protein